MRTLTDAVIAELRNSVVQPFFLVEIAFTDATGPLYLWSGIGDLQYPASTGPTYLGVGLIGSISTISETSEIQAAGVQLGLSGIPSDLVLDSTNRCRQGQVVTIQLGFMNSLGGIIADPILSFVGRLDTAKIEESGDASSIMISVESRLADLQRARIRRFTDDDQQRTCPGDKGFQYQPMVQDWNGAWGAR